MQALPEMIATHAVYSMCAFTAEKSPSVKEQWRGGEVKTISKEVDKRVTQYEVASVLNAEHRDSNPAAAMAAILKKAGAIQ